MNKRVVDTKAAVVAQYSFGIGIDLGRSVTFHPDVRCQTVHVLALGATAVDTAVVADGAVAAVDVNRPAEMDPNIFQQIDQRLAHVDRLRTIGTGKFVYLKMGRQLPISLGAHVVHFYIVYSTSPPQQF